MIQTPVIHIVDDDELFRAALSRLVRVSGFEPRCYASAGEFLICFKPDRRTGCILLDLQMPGPNGLDLLKTLSEQHSFLPIIILTGHGDIPTTVRALKEGAIDFLTKPVEHGALLRAIKAALAQCAVKEAAEGQLAELQASYHSLTARETEVFDQVVAGKRNKEIAWELGAAERTVKAHRAHVMAKMHVGSVAELVQIAVQLQNCRSSEISQYNIKTAGAKSGSPDHRPRS